MAAINTYPAQALELQREQETTSRDSVLRELLPYDYDYAKEAGLIDMFYYDPKIGYDGLLHTLAGDLGSGEGGTLIPRGFHHEPSAEVAWPLVMTKNGALRSTRVDREHLAELPSHKRKPYQEYPFEPYAARVVVDGLVKYAIHRDPQTGEKKLSPAKNSMYPNEYDALAVMQAVRIARSKRNPEQDKLGEQNGLLVKMGEGTVPLVDGVTPMKIRLVLERATDKVITAIPLLPSKPGAMRLTPEEINRHVYGDI